MNLNYLECFTSLSETMSFTETAKDFSVSQPSISRQIKLLEEQLGTKLFIRDKHKVHLTEEGVAFKRRVAPLIKELQTTMHITKDRTDEVKGQLGMGCLGEVGQFSIMEKVLGFNKLYPDVDLKMLYTSPDNIIDKVKTGNLDFGIVNELVDQENLRSYEILTEKSVLVTSVTNKKPLVDIGDAKFVAYSLDDGLLVNYIHKYFKKSSISKINRHIVVNSHKSMIEALVDSNYYAVLPYFSVAKAIKRKELRVASEKELKSKMYLIYVDNALMPKRFQLFKKHLIAECKKKVL
ncbi:MAG: LysR family transcriptional regulator [Bdellovibrionales bacterium]